MNEFLRRVLGLTTTAFLVVFLAVTAAAAVADSGSGRGGNNTSSGNSGSGKSGDDSRKNESETEKEKAEKEKEKAEKEKAEAEKEKSGDRGNSETHRRDGTGILPNPGKPKQGETLNIKPGNHKGKVKVKLPGAGKMVPLEQAASVPVGSVIDASQGQVTLTTVPREDGMVQSATFSGAAFQVNQSKTGKPFTDLRLRGGSFASCGRPFARRSLFGRAIAVASRSSKRKVRSLWGSGHGHFRTRGRGGAATVRGTIWLTQDRCDGTLVKVRRGVVGVRDFKKHKTFTVRKGHSHFARL
jgi:hypothetical protein